MVRFLVTKMRQFCNVFTTVLVEAVASCHSHNMKKVC